MADTPQRQFPILPDVSRSVQAESRDLRTMIYNLQEQLTAAQTEIQNLKAASTTSTTSTDTYSGTIIFSIVGGTVNGRITVAKGLITAVTPAS